MPNVTIKGSSTYPIPFDAIFEFVDRNIKRGVQNHCNHNAIMFNAKSNQEASTLVQSLSAEFPNLLICNDAASKLSLTKEENERIIECIHQRSCGLFHGVLQLSPLMQLTGGFIKSCILDICLPLPHKKYDFRDIDLLVNVLDYTSFKVLVSMCFTLFQSKYKNATQSTISPDVIEFRTEELPFPVQFIWMYGHARHLSKSPTFISTFDHVSNFDLSHVQWHFDGTTIGGTTDAVYSIRTGFVKTHWPVISPSRLAKLKADELVIHPSSAFDLGQDRDQLEDGTRIIWNEEKLGIEKYRTYFNIPSLTLDQIQHFSNGDFYPFTRLHEKSEFFVYPLSIRLTWKDKGCNFPQTLIAYLKTRTENTLSPLDTSSLQSQNDVLEIRITSTTDYGILVSYFHGKMGQKKRKSESGEYEQQSESKQQRVNSTDSLSCSSSLMSF